MQLDLFLDNRRTIRLNDAGDLLRVLRLEEALVIYDELLADEPDDRELLELHKQVKSWRARLMAFSAEPVDSGRLHDLWQKLSISAPPPLVTALRALLIEKLLLLSAPELIYIPPRFHIGAILLTMGRYAEAERWLSLALSSGIEDRARFLAWHGESLNRLGDLNRAKESYLAAFLEGPREVDMALLQSPLIHDLLYSLENEDSELDEADLLAWLPVWGWLRGEFDFRLDDIAAQPDIVGQALEEARQSGSQPTPRLWFGCLRYAEYLRGLAGNNSKLVRVRRWMRQQNEFMFDQYLAKIQNRSSCGFPR